MYVVGNNVLKVRVGRRVYAAVLCDECAERVRRLLESLPREDAERVAYALVFAVKASRVKKAEVVRGVEMALMDPVGRRILSNILDGLVLSPGDGVVVGKVVAALARCFYSGRCGRM